MDVGKYIRTSIWGVGCGVDKESDDYSRLKQALGVDVIIMRLLN